MPSSSGPETKSLQEKSLQVWTLSVPLPKLAGELAARAEAAGWDGIAFTDSQNLTGDVFAGLALAAKATSRIGLATGVTNPVTRHAAATASGIATVHALSNGRAVLGIGRGDSALFQIGLEPAPVADFAKFVADVATYLRGGAVDQRGFASRVRWLADLKLPPVPVDVAATGPRVIEPAAGSADRSIRGRRESSACAGGIEKRARPAAGGARPDTLAFGACVNVAPHPDAAVARELVRERGRYARALLGMAAAPRTAWHLRTARSSGIHARYEREAHTLGRARHGGVDDAFSTASRSSARCRPASLDCSSCATPASRSW
jgi:5,10-methylenetetrahydromethanopterin reductase